LNLRALFVYSQLLIVITAGLYFIRIKAPGILGTASFGADSIIKLTNEKRVANGLNNLTYNPQLAAAASAKAAHMLSENYWAHNSPSGRTPWSFITAAGYRYVFAGENLARDFDSASGVVDAWMNSPSHRANLLDANYKEIGVVVSWGSLTGREGTLVVQNFGTPVSQIPTTTTTAAASPTPTPVVLGSPVVQASPVASGVSVVAQTETAGAAQTQVLASKKFAVGKIASLFLVGFVFLLLVLEVLISVRKTHITLRPQVLAHLAILAVMLFAIWYAGGGAVV